MKNKTKKLLALFMIVATLIGIMTTGASAAGKTKIFTLPCGDGVTLSNYVDEKTDTPVINGVAETVTYYLVDANTQITFDVTSGNTVEGDTMMSELIGQMRTQDTI